MMDAAVPPQAGIHWPPTQQHQAGPYHSTQDMKPSPQGYVDYSLPNPPAHGPMLRFQTPRPRNTRTNPPSVGLFPQGFTAPAPVCYPQEPTEATPRHQPATRTWGPNMTILRPLDAANAAFGHSPPASPQPRESTYAPPANHHVSWRSRIYHAPTSILHPTHACVPI